MIVATVYREGHSRRVWTKLAAEGVAVVCRDLGLGDHLSHLLSDSSCKVPHVTVALVKQGPEGKKERRLSQFEIYNEKIKSLH